MWYIYIYFTFSKRTELSRSFWSYSIGRKGDTGSQIWSQHAFVLLVKTWNVNSSQLLSSSANMFCPTPFCNFFQIYQVNPSWRWGEGDVSHVLLVSFTVTFAFCNPIWKIDMKNIIPCLFRRSGPHTSFGMAVFLFIPGKFSTKI